MLDFACKQFSLKDVIKCALGLTKADQKLLDYFMEHDEEWETTENLAKTLRVNQSTVQRSVKKLFEKGIIARKQQNLDGVGYIYLYWLHERRIVRKVIMETVESWKGRVEKELKKW